MKPNIIIILLDAVRAQNLSIYGYERDTTPNLSQLSEQLTAYENAISTSHWSLPSAASLFTGTYASTHGLIHDDDHLRAELTTLAQFLGKNGYHTMGFCPNPYISSSTKLDKGFELFVGREIDPIKHTLSRMQEKIFEKEDMEIKETNINHSKKNEQNKLYKKMGWYFKGKIDKYAQKTNKRFFSELEKISDEKPFFAYIHYDEAHTPYIIPEKYRDYFMDKEKKPWLINQDWMKYYLKEMSLSKEEFQTLIDIYDGGIRYLDEKISEIYNRLEKKSLLEDTIIIVLSDHGDQFGEHNLYFHLFSLYDQLIKIPLIVKTPDKIKLRKSEIIQNIDMFPTIFDIINSKDMDTLNQLEGNSIFSNRIINRDNKYAYSELLKPFGPRIVKYKRYLKKYDRRLYSVRSKNFKFIYSTNGDHEFYDLSKDPEEKENLIDANLPRKGEYESLIKKWLNSRNCV